jgi:hypothetical protein
MGERKISAIEAERQSGTKSAGPWFIADGEGERRASYLSKDGSYGRDP